MLKDDTDLSTLKLKPVIYIIYIYLYIHNIIN